MSPFASFALLASIAASVTGALVVCVLVFRYGFTIPAPSDADAGPSPTDVLITRVGHAVAAACFAATGVLAVIALSLGAPDRVTRAATTAAVPPPVLHRSVSSAFVENVQPDLTALRKRLADAEAELARLDTEVRSAPPRVASVERPAVRARADARHPRPSMASGVPATTERGHARQLLMTTRKAWEASRDRAVDFVGDVRTAWVRVERAVARHVSTDAAERGSVRD